MGDRHLAPLLSVRLSPEDHEWLATLAKRAGTTPAALVQRAVRFFRFWQANENIVEAASLAAYVQREYEKQARRQRYVQCQYRAQSRRLYNQRRVYQRRLWNEQNLRHAYEKRLRDEQNLRRAYERQLRHQRDCYERQLRRQREYYEQQARQAANAPRDALYSPTVARLLALAVCSGSDAEANAAFTRARTLYRIRTLSMVAVTARAWRPDAPIAALPDGAGDLTMESGGRRTFQ